jgi:hypothetical protein
MVGELADVSDVVFNIVQSRLPEDEQNIAVLISRAASHQGR